jgi:hypothetical protein
MLKKTKKWVRMFVFDPFGMKGEIRLPKLPMDGETRK